VALVTVSLAQRYAHADVYAITLVEERGTDLGIVGGAVRPVPSKDGGEWSLSVPDKQGTTTIRIVSEDNRIYLAYDKKGKRPTVFLSKDPVDWKLTHVGGVTRYTVQAAQGKYKDWYLTVSKARNDRDRRLLLTRKPKPLPQFSIYEVSH
jgi:hypothetical protein